MTETLYEQDYYLWLETTAQQLRERRLNELDWEHLLEEIEDLAKNSRRELKNRLVVLLAHLLKWKYQPEKLPYYGNSWISTITEQRRQIEFLLEDSPSLKPFLLEVFAGCYAKARRDASKETGLPIDTFPAQSPFTPEEALNPDYLPEE
jgi:hypothetical protein